MSSLWSHSFPSPELVQAAAGLLPRLPAWDGREGPRSRLIVAPGVLAVSQRDPARAERAAEAALRRRQTRVKLEAVELLLPDLLADAESAEAAVVELVRLGLVEWSELESAADRVEFLTDAVERLAEEPGGRPASITSWSRRSRARMVKVLGQLDYAPLFDSGRPPAMLTLTYPGDWAAVAPHSKACKKHVDAFKKRFERHYGIPLIGIWKREFQRRGAPHYHILMVPPAAKNGESFQVWASRTWADVVGAECCGGGTIDGRRVECIDVGGCEYHRHLAAGTGVDFAEGMRARDPKRLAVYFSKHGAFSAKEYQNEAPAAWVEAGSVGRFWGVWGLEKSLAVVEVRRDVADAAARTLRRWARANGYVAPVEVWRLDTKKAARVEAAGGDLEAAGVRSVWRKRKSRRRVKRMPGRLGFVMVNDGPAFASQLARYLDQL